MSRCSRVWGITPSSAAIDQHGEVDAAGAGQHVLDEALVAGHVDDPDREAARLLEEGEAELDGDAARLLLRQAVGVDAGEGLDQRGLAVVDVAGRADDDVSTSVSWHRRPAGTCGLPHAYDEAPGGVGEAAASRRSDPAGRSGSRGRAGRRSCDRSPADRRGAGPRRAPGRPPAWRRRRGRLVGSCTVGRAPPPTSAWSSTLRSHPLAHRRIEAGEQLAGPAPHVGERLRQRPQRGDRLPRGSGLVGVERRFQGGDGELVDPQRAVPRVLLQPRHHLARARPGCRPAARRAACRPRTRRGRRPRRRPPARSARTESPSGRRSTSEPEPRSSMTGIPRCAPQLGQLAGAHVGREADHPVVRRVHLEQESGLGADRLGVVAQVRPVGGADLPQHGTAAPHDVGDAELAADLDQLAAGDDDLLAVRQRLEGQQDRGRVVVDDERVLGAGQPAQQRLDVAVARAALLGCQVELQVRVGLPDRRDAARAPAGSTAHGPGSCGAPRRWH